MSVSEILRPYLQDSPYPAETKLCSNSRGLGSRAMAATDGPTPRPGGYSGATSSTETRASQGGENDRHKNPTDTMTLPGIRRHHRELAIAGPAINQNAGELG